MQSGTHNAFHTHTDQKKKKKRISRKMVSGRREIKKN